MGEQYNEGAITIRYRLYGRDNRLYTYEKTFKTEEAMRKWIERQEESNDRWGGVDAYSR